MISINQLALIRRANDHYGEIKFRSQLRYRGSFQPGERMSSKPRGEHATSSHWMRVLIDSNGPETLDDKVSCRCESESW